MTSERICPPDARPDGETTTMTGLPHDWKDHLVAWAQRNDSVRELWLFGSQGPKGGAHPTSDVDIGLTLMPAIGNHNWALGNFAALGDDWQSELEAIVGRHVSLEAMVPATKAT
jgi:predicted nucleotidyltransferase